MDPIDSAIRPLNHRALATKLSLDVEAYYWGPMGGGGVVRGGEGSWWLQVKAQPTQGEGHLCEIYLSCCLSYPNLNISHFVSSF